MCCWSRLCVDGLDGCVVGLVLVLMVMMIFLKNADRFTDFLSFQSFAVHETLIKNGKSFRGGNRCSNNSKINAWVSSSSLPTLMYRPFNGLLPDELPQDLAIVGL